MFFFRDEDIAGRVFRKFKFAVPVHCGYEKTTSQISSSAYLGAALTSRAVSVSLIALPEK
jgi:hypothetical protein